MKLLLITLAILLCASATSAEQLSFYGCIGFNNDGSPQLEKEPFLTIKHFSRIEFNKDNDSALITLTKLGGQLNLKETTKRKRQRVVLIYNGTVIVSPLIIEPTEQEIAISGDSINTALAEKMMRSIQTANKVLSKE